MQFQISANCLSPSGEKAGFQPQKFRISVAKNKCNSNLSWQSTDFGILRRESENRDFPNLKAELAVVHQI